MLVDSHCHVNFNAYSKDAEDVIRRSLANNTWLVNIGSQLSTSRRTIKIAQNYQKGVYAVVGLHPIHLTQDITESAKFDGKEYKFVTRQEVFDYDTYRKLAKSSDKVVALGEVGLDYYYFDEMKDDPDKIKKIQVETLNKFIDLADELNLPLVLHCRGTKKDVYGAYDDLLEILRLKVKNKKLKGVVHCFGGNLVQAKGFIDFGFYIGFTGIITFKKSLELREIAKIIPLEKILVETDAPFLAPEPHRGERNEPIYVEFVAKKIAEVRAVSFEEVARTTTANAKKLFGI
ncbi:MAG: TatD family hydrolase [Patescibacteria group bacterium]|jgi:TatD DNase family protein